MSKECKAVTDRPILNSAPLVATPEMIQAALDLVWENSETHDQLVQAIWQSMHKASQEKAITTAAYDVLQERKRQIEVEGWTLKHDDKHKGGEMAFAAASYIIGVSTLTGGVSKGKLSFPWSYRIWPRSWDLKWWKPKSQRENYVRAGALILAEIDRLDRLPSSPGASE